jgi:hypothetical protein
LNEKRSVCQYNSIVTFKFLATLNFRDDKNQTQLILQPQDTIQIQSVADHKQQVVDDHIGKHHREECFLNLQLEAEHIKKWKEGNLRMDTRTS